MRVVRIIAPRDGKSQTGCPRRIYVFDARLNVAHSVRSETPRACERSSTQATGEGLTVGHKSVLAVQVGNGVFADGRWRIDNAIAAAASGAPESRSHR